jgi:hypothetical protein
MVRFFSGLGGVGDFASAFRRVTHPGRISLIKIVGLPNLGCSPCLRAPPWWFFIFPVPCDYGDIAPLCSPLPAFLSRRPTPHSTFVENKDPTPIRPSGHRAVEALFSRFSAVQSGPISAYFFRFYCSVGRGSQGPLPLLPMLTQHDPGCPNTTQGFGGLWDKS